MLVIPLNENGLPEATLRKSTKMEVNELRGIVIKLFYHTLALLHFTFLFHIPDTSIWMGQKHAFSPAF